MPDSPAKSRSFLTLALGMAATLVVVAVHVSGIQDRLEMQTLDLRFRTLGTAPENPDLVHVDIDDDSLGELGRWPWPRELLAGIVETLCECGASTVALDIIMPEPQRTRYVSAEHDVYSAEAGEVIGAGRPLPVFDDMLLGEAIGRAGNVLVPLYIDMSRKQSAALERDMTDLLSADPTLSLRQAADSVAGEAGGVDVEAIVKAYLAGRSLSELRRFGIPFDRVEGFPVRSGVAVTPLVTFSREICGSGFVTVRPDGDGGVRRIPLLARQGDVVWPQFALTLAARRLARDHGGGYEISADGGSVRIVCSDGLTRSIPADRNGDMLINWARRGRDTVHPRHIRAGAVGKAWRLGGDVQANDNLSRLLYVQLAEKLGLEDLKKLFDEAGGLYQRRIACLHEAQRAALFEPGRAPPDVTPIEAEEQRVEREIQKLCLQLRKDLDEFYLASEPDDAQGKADFAQLSAIRAMLDQIEAANQDSRRLIAESKARIREMVAGRICLVGSTATGAADFVPTAMGERTPGVVVHANILNTIVSGAFIRQAHPVLEAALIVAVGLLATLIAARLPVLQGGPLLLALAGAYAAVNALVVFHLLNVQLVFWAPIEAMGAGFVVITAYRQLTEERAKRRIRGLFAHALSPALVDRLLEDPSLARLGGERRVLSCFFSDIAGFTPLSERLGEQRTVRLLNHYFDHMTDVIQNRRGGYLNKFLGDGIFVFFGAPVFQSDHAARSILAALDCQSEVARLNEELAAESDDHVELRCRVGITTGEAMVGNCGSTERMDYTAIGDTVNLASRLESANKFFGTQILISEETWRAGACEDVLARPLGAVVVVGKTEPVRVWNVLARADGSAGGLKAACEAFTRGVELFAARKFVEAAGAFEQAAGEMPGDVASAVYLELCRKFRDDPPGDEWDGAIHLTEK